MPIWMIIFIVAQSVLFFFGGMWAVSMQFRIEALEAEQALRSATEQAMLLGAKKEGYGY